MRSHSDVLCCSRGYHQKEQISSESVLCCHCFDGSHSISRWFARLHLFGSKSISWLQMTFSTSLSIKPLKTTHHLLQLMTRLNSGSTLKKRSAVAEFSVQRIGRSLRLSCKPIPASDRIMPMDVKSKFALVFLQTHSTLVQPPWL
ncbi:hypothetical protein OSTOST_12227 [Ostertagia ostertagi]